ncbi:MAG: TonB-dependent receptor [Bacteroidota bacterium]
MKATLNPFLRLVFTLIFSCSALLLVAQGSVEGTVIDDNGDPAIGANVLVSETGTGAITDLDGKYSITLDAGEYTLVISYVGYQNSTQTVTITNGGTAVVDVTLNTSAIGLDGVVVTGSFTSRSQKNSPISMTVLNARQLAVASFNSQADILRNIPGITAEGGGGEVASNVFVRGLPSGGQYQFTPLQVDGIPVLSTFGLNSSAHDVYFRNDIGVRNLEFVRGGASTLFGAGSVAGIINYTSITGTSEQQNKVGLEWAEGGRLKADFLTAGPISDTWFYAFSGFYRYDEGPLETGLNTRGYQVRGNLKKLFNDGESSFKVYGQMIDDNVQFYLPYPLANNNGDFERPIGNDGEEIFTMLTGAATDFSFDTPNGRFESPIENGVITKGGYLMAELDHSFGDGWRLKSKAKVASYDHWFNLFLDGDGIRNVPETQENYLADRTLADDGVFTYVDDGTMLDPDDLVFENRVLDRERPMEEMVGEFNLTKTISGHNITIGTFLSNTRAEDNNWIWNYLGDFSNSPRLVDVSFGDGTSHSAAGFISGSQTSNRYHQSTKTAIYLADEYKGERFSFDIGLRWERAAGFISRETGVGSNTFQKGTVSASDVAVAIAGLYELNDNINIYANASRGYFFPELRSVQFPTPGVPQSYETEKIIQGEVGVKASGSRFEVTGAIFIVALNDRRSIDFVNDGQGGVVEEVFTQSTRTFGVEATGNVRIAKGFSANAIVTYQNHQFTEVENNAELEGNWLRRQPQFKGTIGLDYNNSGFDANANYTYLGKRFANDGNTVELDPYGLLRAGAGYTFEFGDNESVRIGVAVFNLLDSAGITEGSPRQGNTQTGAADFFVGRPILPRRVAVNALFSF